MLFKLALRNAKRSMRDYSVYLLTVTIAFSLMYAFNMVVFSEEIRGISQIMGSLAPVICFISVIVIAVIAWLVNYMNRFMLEKRSRELGTYMLLGIGSGRISRMVLLENMIMGGAAFAAALCIGTFLYQILTMVIMNLFEVRYAVRDVFSIPAVLLTFFYVLLIYTFSLLRMKKRLKKIKICSLIYAEKQNETALLSGKKGHWFLCVLSVALLAAGCVLLYLIFHNTALFSAAMLSAGITLIIGGLYGAYITLAAFLVKLFLGGNERKYAKDHLFIYRNLSAKLKTMSVTVGTLAMLLTLTLACMQSAMLFNRFFELSALNRCTFDAQVSAKDTSVFAEAEEYFERTRGIKASLRIPIYDCGQRTLYDALELDSYVEEDYAVSFSDYAAMRQMLGYEPVTLEGGRYILHAYAQIKRAADEKGALPYSINGTGLTLQAVYDEPLSQNGSIGAGCIIVLPDELTVGLDIPYTTLAIDTLEDTTPEDWQYLTDRFKGDRHFSDWSANAWDTKGNQLSTSRSSILVFGFSLYYTGLIFICTAASILAVQQLSEASKYRFRYSILSKLGVPDARIGRLIFHQLLLYFGIPLLLPVPLSIFISSCVNTMLQTMISPAAFRASVAVGLGIFLMIYILYFAAACVGYRRSVLN